ncbi:hypothetical protein Tsubulata_021374 [Turnera subulata]|uniref:RRM domain-containing protein n=1 Tax=Turnera subulata TaxID=218843 RepID=A0A9Q0FYP9_9ROSI|nr:hypothetical protein Tsubulata_021374 [Turnera subulata]
MAGRNLNLVFYADKYHPIQAGSIDGTDTAPHDNAIYRALLCSSAGLYDPLGDPKLIGDPYCTVFVGRLSHLTTEETLHKAMSKYGRVKNLRLVRHIVTGASRGYGFVEFETEKEMRRAYKDAHHSFIDDSQIIVDYSRQQLMPGWIPRRLGGGLGGKKESGQLRFGGRERPFRAPLHPIPYDDLKRLGIPPPPEGRYMSRFEVPSPPRRESSSMDREESSHKGSCKGRHSRRSSSRDIEEYHNRRNSIDMGESFNKAHPDDTEEHHLRGHSIDRNEPYLRGESLERENRHHRRSSDRERHHYERSPVDWEESSRKRSAKMEDGSHQSSRDRQEHSHRRSTRDRKESSRRRSSRDRDDDSRKRHKHGSRYDDKHRRRRSTSRDGSDH